MAAHQRGPFPTGARRSIFGGLDTDGSVDSSGARSGVRSTFGPVSLAYGPELKELQNLQARFDAAECLAYATLEHREKLDWRIGNTVSPGSHDIGLSLQFRGTR